MKTIRLSERELHVVVCESVKKILNELGPKTAALHKLAINHLESPSAPLFKYRPSLPTPENNRERASKAQSMDAEILHQAFIDTCGNLKIHFQEYFDNILQYEFTFHIGSLSNITDHDVLLYGVKYAKDKSPEVLQIKYNFREKDANKRFSLYHPRARVSIKPHDNDEAERRPYNTDKPLNNSISIPKLDRFIQDYLSVNPHGNSNL